MPGAVVERTTYRNTSGSLTGQRVVIEGLSALRTDVLLLVQLREGTQHSAILRPVDPAFTIPARAGKWEVARDYLGWQAPSGSRHEIGKERTRMRD